jgi:hypothetical protein
MDGVDAMRDLPRNFPSVNSTFVAVADPFYKAFDGGKKIYKGEALILTVSLLALGVMIFMTNVAEGVCLPFARLVMRV